MAKEVKKGIYMADRPEEERREKFTLTPRDSEEEPDESDE